MVAGIGFYLNCFFRFFNNQFFKRSNANIIVRVSIRIRHSGLLCIVSKPFLLPINSWRSIPRNWMPICFFSGQITWKLPTGQGGILAFYGKKNPCLQRPTDVTITLGVPSLFRLARLQLHINWVFSETRIKQPCSLEACTSCLKNLWSPWHISHSVTRNFKRTCDQREYCITKSIKTEERSDFWVKHGLTV